MGADRTRPMGPTIDAVTRLFDKTPEQEGEDQARAKLRDAQRRAQARLAELVAAKECPADLVEWGRLHRIPEFAKATWQAGFLAGMRYRELLGEAPEEAGDESAIRRAMVREMRDMVEAISLASPNAAEQGGVRWAKARMLHYLAELEAAIP